MRTFCFCNILYRETNVCSVYLHIKGLNRICHLVRLCCGNLIFICGSCPDTLLIRTERGIKPGKVIVLQFSNSMNVLCPFSIPCVCTQASRHTTTCVKEEGLTPRYCSSLLGCFSSLLPQIATIIFIYTLYKYIFTSTLYKYLFVQLNTHLFVY